MPDDLDKWRRMLAGEKVPMHLDEPICGYFKIRDRRGLNAQLAPIKRPWIACAIWRGEDGELKAEMAGAACEVERLWPYCAKYPVTYEAYAHWHATEKWPETEKVP